MADNVVCPVNCETALPSFSYDKCARDTRLAEITHLFMGRPDRTAFDDWTDPAEWATNLAQTGATADLIRTLFVRGNKPATTKETTVLTGNVEVVTRRTHVINFVIDDVNDVAYDFIRTFQCGAIRSRIWFSSNATKELAGGENGILATVWAEAVYAEGTNTVQQFVGTVTWDDLQDPPRITNPIAGLD